MVALAVKPPPKSIHPSPSGATKCCQHSTRSTRRYSAFPVCPARCLLLPTTTSSTTYLLPTEPLLWLLFFDKLMKSRNSAFSIVNSYFPGCYWCYQKAIWQYFWHALACLLIQNSTKDETVSGIDDASVKLLTFSMQWCQIPFQPYSPHVLNVYPTKQLRFWNVYL